MVINMTYNENLTRTKQDFTQGYKTGFSHGSEIMLAFSHSYHIKWSNLLALISHGKMLNSS